MLFGTVYISNSWNIFIGCPRVHGDEEEDNIDDVENEFNFENDRVKHDFQCYGFDYFEQHMPSRDSRHQLPQVPLPSVMHMHYHVMVL